MSDREFNMGKMALVDFIQGIINRLNNIADTLNIGIENANRYLSSKDQEMAYNEISTYFNISLRANNDLINYVSNTLNDQAFRNYLYMFFMTSKNTSKFINGFSNYINEKLLLLSSYMQYVIGVVNLHIQYFTTKLNQEITTLPTIQYRSSYKYLIDALNDINVNKCFSAENKEYPIEIPGTNTVIPTGIKTLRCLILLIANLISNTEHTGIVDKLSMFVNEISINPDPQYLSAFFG